MEFFLWILLMCENVMIFELIRWDWDKYFQQIRWCNRINFAFEFQPLLPTEAEQFKWASIASKIDVYRKVIEEIEEKEGRGIELACSVHWMLAQNYWTELDFQLSIWNLMVCWLFMNCYYVLQGCEKGKTRVSENHLGGIAPPSYKSTITCIYKYL